MGRALFTFNIWLYTPSMYTSGYIHQDKDRERPNRSKILHIQRWDLLHQAHIWKRLPTSGGLPVRKYERIKRFNLLHHPTVLMLHVPQIGPQYSLVLVASCYT